MYASHKGSCTYFLVAVCEARTVRQCFVVPLFVDFFFNTSTKRRLSEVMVILVIRINECLVMHATLVITCA